MIVLGIESSCDDTAAAVLDGRVVRSSVVSSQDAVHGPFGGIVPEIASRHHLENALPVVHAALSQAGLGLDDVEGIAVTRGPGLVGSLLVGLSVAKGIARARSLPIVGVNHLEGHVLAIFLERTVAFPYLALLVSGGHTSLVLAHRPGAYEPIGRTRDDAAGEAFDKAGKMLGLGFPAGRILDDLGRDGNREAVRFPRASVRGCPYDFSFSGLKTALRQYLEGQDTHVPVGGRPASPPDSPEALRDVAASFQEAIVDVLAAAVVRAAAERDVPRVVVSGGVSANSRLRARMAEEAAREGFEVFFPPVRFCTDNAAMIAYAGSIRLERGECDPASMNAVASWPLAGA